MRKADDDFRKALHQAMADDAHKNRDKDFREWCAALENLPSDFELKLPNGFVADVELQPFRWLNRGVDLLQSSKGTITVKHFDGAEGSFLDSYLPYPVFQMGTEIFLKGMWLCQFPDCRALAYDGYVEPVTRRAFLDRLKKEVGHDLLKAIAANRQVSTYQADPKVTRFLNLIEAIVRESYFPLYQADNRGNEWAHSRYPKRFYDDSSGQGAADAYQSYPQQWAVVRLFEAMQQHLEQSWQLRAGLAAQRKTKCPKP